MAKANITPRAKDDAQWYLDSVAEEQGFVRVYWDGTRADEERIKADTKATVRVLPCAQAEAEGLCFLTHRPTKRQAIFARSY